MSSGALYGKPASTSAPRDGKLIVELLKDMMLNLAQNEDIVKALGITMDGIKRISMNLEPDTFPTIEVEFYATKEQAESFSTFTFLRKDL